MDPAVLAVLKKACGSVRIPAGGDKVHKDECAYSFDGPVSFRLWMWSPTILGEDRLTPFIFSPL
jgi:hypothetical protein